MSAVMMMYDATYLNSITTMEQLACFVLSWNWPASSLYNAWSMAIYMRSESKKYNFTFSYNGVCQNYTGCQIIQLENESRCPSLTTLLQNSNTMDGVIRVFFKLRIQLMGLFSAYPLALDMRSRGLKYVYTFTNPFFGQTLSGVNTIPTLGPTFKMNTDCIINMDCACTGSASQFGCGC
jgi:hypothetical protein